MKDRLEDFISQNRNSFDDKEPSGKIWSRIEKALELSSRSLWNSLTLWRAAAVIFMLLSFYLMIPLKDRRQNEIALREFNDVEAFYSKQISDKVQLIDEFTTRDAGEGLNGFTHDFQQLEAMYLVLKEEMKNRPSQKVKDALILNLLVRLDLLNQRLHKLERENDPVDNKPGAST